MQSHDAATSATEENDTPTHATDASFIASRTLTTPFPRSSTMPPALPHPHAHHHHHHTRPSSTSVTTVASSHRSRTPQPPMRLDSAHVLEISSSSDNVSASTAASTGLNSLEVEVSSSRYGSCGGTPALPVFCPSTTPAGGLQAAVLDGQRVLPPPAHPPSVLPPSPPLRRRGSAEGQEMETHNAPLAGGVGVGVAAATVVGNVPICPEVDVHAPPHQLQLQPFWRSVRQQGGSPHSCSHRRPDDGSSLNCDLPQLTHTTSSANNSSINNNSSNTPSPMSFTGGAGGAALRTPTDAVAPTSPSSYIRAAAVADSPLAAQSRGRTTTTTTTTTTTRRSSTSSTAASGRTHSRDAAAVGSAFTPSERASPLTPPTQLPADSPLSTVIHPHVAPQPASPIIPPWVYAMSEQLSSRAASRTTTVTTLNASRDNLTSTPDTIAGANVDGGEVVALRVQLTDGEAEAAQRRQQLPATSARMFSTSHGLPWLNAAQLSTPELWNDAYSTPLRPTVEDGQRDGGVRTLPAFAPRSSTTTPTSFSAGASATTPHTHVSSSRRSSTSGTANATTTTTNATTMAVDVVYVRHVARGVEPPQPPSSPHPQRIVRLDGHDAPPAIAATTTTTTSTTTTTTTALIRGTTPSAVVAHPASTNTSSRMAQPHPYSPHYHTNAAPATHPSAGLSTTYPLDPRTRAARQTASTDAVDDAAEAAHLAHSIPDRPSNASLTSFSSGSQTALPHFYVPPHLLDVLNATQEPHLEDPQQQPPQQGGVAGQHGADWRMERAVQPTQTEEAEERSRASLYAAARMSMPNSLTSPPSA